MKTYSVKIKGRKTPVKIPEADVLSLIYGYTKLHWDETHRDLPLIPEDDGMEFVIVPNTRINNKEEELE